MLDRESVKACIRMAFADGEYPGDWRLRCSEEGDEPYLLEQQFKGKTDWQSLDPKFLDEAPGGLASALDFFSDEAFRFYLPAYLLADIDGRLERANPVFHLCLGLDDASQNVRIDPRRERTWFEHARHKFAMFSREQAKAIVAYLRYKCESTDLLESDIKSIEQALCRYWLERAGESSASDCNRADG